MFLTAILTSGCDWSCPTEAQTGQSWERGAGMRAGFLLPQSQSSFPQAGCLCSGMRGCLSPPAAHSFSRHPSLPVKLGRPMTRGHSGRNWAFKCQVPAHVMAGKGCLAVSTDHWPCAAHKAQRGGTSNLLALDPCMGLPSSAVSGPGCPNSAMCEQQPFWKPRSPGRFDYVLVVPPR